MTGQESFLGPKHEIIQTPIEGDAILPILELINLETTVMPGEVPVPTEELIQILEKIKRERLEGL